MQRDLVEKHGWLDRRDFLRGVALGQAMPGPLAAQVVMWVGYLRAGALGALATSIPFILPSFALVLTVAFLLRPVLGARGGAGPVLSYRPPYRPDGNRYVVGGGRGSSEGVPYATTIS